MKLKCLHKNTNCPDSSGNTDEQNICDTDSYRNHLGKISFKERPFVPKDIQYVKSFVQMKYILIGIGFFVLVSCNNKSKQNEQKFSNVYYQSVFDTLITESRKKDYYADMIPYLESGLTSLEGSKALQIKIKLELSGLYLLDYNMDARGFSKTSLDKSIIYFEEVLKYDADNEFFINELGLSQKKADSIHNIWMNIKDEKRRTEVLFELTEELYLKVQSN